MERIKIRITSHRVRLQDPDNNAGSCKDLLDGLRHAGLIHGDEPDKIELHTTQKKVGKMKDQGTEIELIYREGSQ